MSDTAQLLENKSRLHERFIDFNTARFVVGKASGLNVGGNHLVMGDLVPEGVLSAEALRLEYGAPPANLELLEFAMTLPYLREACARRGVMVEEPKPVIIIPDYSTLDREELVLLCSEQGLPTTGNKQQLCKRLMAAAAI